MVDNAAVVAADPRGFQPLAHRPGVVGELWDVLRGNGERVIVDQEKPVAAPGNIADDGAERGLHADLLFPAAGRDVLHRYAAIVVQCGAYVADRGFNQMYAWLDTAKPRQRGDKPDGAVAAHIQKTGVVEENDASGGRRRDRLAQQRADQHIVAARFENHRLTPAIEVTGETVAALRHAAAAEVGEAVNDQAGGFAAGV